MGSNVNGLIFGLGSGVVGSPGSPAGWWLRVGGTCSLLGRDCPGSGVDVTLRTSDRMLLTVEEAAERLSISRAQMWRLIGSGDVASLHVGRLRRVEPEALARYVARMRGQQPPPAA